MRAALRGGGRTAARLVWALLAAAGAAGAQGLGPLPAPAASAAAFATAPALAEPAALVTATGTVHGTLLRPAPGRPTSGTVVLIISGSGPTDRDGNTVGAPAGNDSLKRLAEALAAQGHASLRYDKRGLAASRAAGPAEAELRFDTYVADAAAWLQQLKADARFARVVVLGHSEGSLIGMLAAEREAVAGLVSLAGPARRASDVLRTQLQGRLPPDLAARSEAILLALETGGAVPEVPPALAALYRPSVQPYLASWFRHTPSAVLARHRGPCLVLQGDTDIQVAVGEAQALHAAQPVCALAVIPGMNHVLKAVPADRAKQLASYTDPTLPLAPGLAEALGDFLQRLPARP